MTKCRCGKKINKYASLCNKCHKEKLEAIFTENKAIVERGICPDCGSGLHHNNALTDWYQCNRFGADDRRIDKTGTSCNFQIFLS